MSWFDRYLVGCPIAVVFFAGVGAYRRPVFAALVVGGVVGAAAHDATSGRAG